jgi:hypothetical protein
VPYGIGPAPTGGTPAQTGGAPGPNAAKLREGVTGGAKRVTPGEASAAASGVGALTQKKKTPVTKETLYKSVTPEGDVRPARTPQEAIYGKRGAPSESVFEKLGRFLAKTRVPDKRGNVQNLFEGDINYLLRQAGIGENEGHRDQIIDRLKARHNIESDEELIAELYRVFQEIVAEQEAKKKTVAQR